MNFVVPQYSPRERIADFIVHLLGIVGSIVGIVVLLVVSIGTWSALAVVSVSVYGIGLLAVFCCSAAYNHINHLAWKAVFRRLDHAAIYVKIAATYTPFAAVKMTIWPGAGLLAGVWAAAIFGLTLKLWFPERLIKTSYVLYLTQGWAVLLVAQPLATAVSDLTLVMLCIGGVLYTTGVVFHLWESLPYHNAIWHAFVVAGSSCHYVAVLDSMSVA